MSVFAAVALLAVAGAGPGPLSGVDVSREAVNYAGSHTTPRGKAATVSRHGVLKTTEPPTSSHGATT
ncbi:hypothetical protein [Pyrobaculum ferrireducens]|uniref:Uncharacterized protein n=1 Tax=Pyrobaculum ferrireducens TaxID=1104324 RepID=G7VEC2_9CREN|nr:hypothetical protein [Pyrobaculum ferrireducens]AET34092.1 hypothetical protein P186_2708 [Pyrobaculum ferrireducens]